MVDIIISGAATFQETYFGIESGKESIKYLNSITHHGYHLSFVVIVDPHSHIMYVRYMAKIVLFGFLRR